MENTRIIFTLPADMKKRLERIAQQQSDETRTVSVAQLLRMGAQQIIDQHEQTRS